MYIFKFSHCTDIASADVNIIECPEKIRIPVLQRILTCLVLCSPCGWMLIRLQKFGQVY